MLPIALKTTSQLTRTGQQVRVRKKKKTSSSSSGRVSDQVIRGNPASRGTETSAEGRVSK
jgi:hypothetical protein